MAGEREKKSSRTAKASNPGRVRHTRPGSAEAVPADRATQTEGDQLLIQEVPEPRVSKGGKEGPPQATGQVRTEPERRLHEIWPFILEHSGAGRTPSRPADFDSLENIQYGGMYLQWALCAGRWQEAEEVAGRLATVARLNDVNTDELERPRDQADSDEEVSYSREAVKRIAAAYHLWPFFAARCYGYAHRFDNQERHQARSRLCQIQRLLYATTRWTADFLRESFGLITYEGVQLYLCGERRANWRPGQSFKDFSSFRPDLCAVDWVAEEICRLITSRPRQRLALKLIHKFALRGMTDDAAVAEVIGAFQNLHVAQLTIFYHPHPHTLRLREDFPLRELVHFAETEYGLTGLDRLLPFHCRRDGAWVEDEFRHGFRALAHAIYSTNSGRHRSFKEQREATIAKLHETKIVSGGSVTHQFLKHPPVVDEQMWPVWYKPRTHERIMSLAEDVRARRNDREAAGHARIEDWSETAAWWQRLETQPLPEVLFPGEQGGSVHDNHHASAFWDYRAHKA